MSLRITNALVSLWMLILLQVNGLQKPTHLMKDRLMDRDSKDSSSLAISSKGHVSKSAKAATTPQELVKTASTSKVVCEAGTRGNGGEADCSGAHGWSEEAWGTPFCWEGKAYSTQTEQDPRCADNPASTYKGLHDGTWCWGTQRDTACSFVGQETTCEAGEKGPGGTCNCAAGAHGWSDGEWPNPNCWEGRCQVNKYSDELCANNPENTWVKLDDGTACWGTARQTECPITEEGTSSDWELVCPEGDDGAGGTCDCSTVTDWSPLTWRVHCWSGKCHTTSLIPYNLCADNEETYKRLGDGTWCNKKERKAHCTATPVCEENCNACSDSTTCTECKNGKFLSSGDCLDSCPEGYEAAGESSETGRTCKEGSWQRVSKFCSEPTGLVCEAIASPTTDSWCNQNCNHIPPNCPEKQCQCSTPAAGATKLAESTKATVELCREECFDTDTCTAINYVPATQKCETIKDVNLANCQETPPDQEFCDMFIHEALNYATGQEAQNDCPSGYSNIVTQSACQAAAVALGEADKTDVDETADQDNRPKGCFFSTDGSNRGVYLNPNPGTPSSPATLTHPVCSKAVGSTSTCSVLCEMCKDDGTCATCPPGKTLTSSGDCLDHCPAGQYTSAENDYVCTDCNGVSRRRRANICTGCPPGNVNNPGFDNCQNIQETCDHGSCEACADCITQATPHLQSCLAEQGLSVTCLDFRDIWCHTFESTMMNCEASSTGCYYKIMCHSPCICDGWKTVRCGGEVNDPSETCTAAAFAQVTDFLGISGKIKLKQNTTLQAHEEPKAASALARAKKTSARAHGLEKSLNDKCVER